jgi:uncharacterized protein (TIGR03790 family)
MRSSRLIAALALALLVPAAARAQTADNVLLVVNDASPESVHVGQYYASKRGLADDHVVHLKVSADETIQRAKYEQLIEAPIAAAVAKNSLQDRILYIVLTKGIPLRVAGTGGTDGTVASVDSELTLLYRKMVGTSVPILGPVPNPLFLGEQALDKAKSITRFDTDIYLVTRLDGYTVQDVEQLIDRGLAPARDGRIVLDEKATLLDAGGDAWLDEAASRLRQTPFADQVMLETTRALAATTDPVLGYYSWGSNDPSNRLRHFGFHFVNGAIGGMFVSTDGRTFKEPPANWQPGPGSGQSLAGDLIRDGITGVSAYTDEPYLGGTVRPQILFPAYLAGFSLADAFYLAMPYLSWQTMVIGDPLCAPFQKHVLVPSEIAQGLDPDTDLPALFSKRRLAVLSSGGMNADALKIVLKAEAAQEKGDTQAVEPLLDKAVSLEPRLTAAELQLASLNENRGEYDKAIERYRKVLAVDTGNVIALNNLAYALAVRKHAPEEALPLAERARRGSNLPVIADTLGWIHHLLGDDAAAAPLIEEAVRGAAGNAEIQLHAAFVHAALGDLARARVELAAAEKLDPSLAQRADVKALEARIK